MFLLSETFLSLPNNLTPKGKSQIDFSIWLSFMPATTGVHPELVEEPALSKRSAPKGLPHTFACSTIGPALLNLF